MRMYAATVRMLSRPGLLKLLVATPFGVTECNIEVAKQLGLTNQI